LAYVVTLVENNISGQFLLTVYLGALVQLLPQITNAGLFDVH